MNILNPIRMAGTKLATYLTSPASYAAMGRQVAMDTAIGTAASQIIPRVIGKSPNATIPQSLLQHGAGALVNAPIAGSLGALGVPGSAAQLAGQIAAAPVSHAVSNIINPEQSDVPHPNTQHLMQLQQMQADAEQQHYNNQINLALAKNYNPPSHIYHHNPSSELDTMHKILAGNVPKY